MIIGAIRPEEARIYDSHEGYHRFHAAETQEKYGSFAIYWQDFKAACSCGEYQECDHGTGDTKAGWYWRAGFPGCLPDGDAIGPFATSRQALQDADEWNPEFDGTNECVGTLYGTNGNKIGQWSSDGRESDNE